MAVTADQVKVILDAEVDGYNAEIKQSVTVFEASMTKMERAAVQTENRVGQAMSRTAKLTSNQLQTIQYTVNDVIASLASGGNPLTILAQQGGQVTQAFGGLGGTLRTLAPFAFSAGGALTAMGVALGAAVIAADRFDASNKDLLVSVTGLGSRAGLTVDQLKELAAANAEAGNVSQTAAEKMAQSYISTGRIGAEVTGKLIAITDDYARVTGTDAAKATETLGKAFSDPIQGANLLQQQFGTLTPETYRLIQQMVAAGDTMGAQKVLADNLSGTVAGQADNVSFLTKMWRGLKDAISDAATAARDFANAQPGAGNARTGGARGAADRALTAAGQAAQTAGQRARNVRGIAGQQAIDQVLGNDRRTAISSEISKIEAAVKDGTVNAKDASRAIKKLKEDMQSIGAGPKAPKPTKAEEREAIARREGRVAGPAVFGTDSKYGTGLNTDTVSVDDLKALEQIFISKGGLEEYLRNGGGDFVPAGTGAVAEASDSLKRYQEELHDSTYTAIRGGLQAGFENGLPGVLQYFGNQLTSALLDRLAEGLTQVFTQKGGFGSGGSGGGVLSVFSKLFGRANGGNMVGGVPYKINEGKAEVFVPPSSGKMVPVSRLTGNGGTMTQNITFRQVIDLKGANGDETIYRISRQAAAEGAAQALAAANKAAPGRQANYAKLGT